MALSLTGCEREAARATRDPKPMLAGTAAAIAATRPPTQPAVAVADAGRSQSAAGEVTPEPQATAKHNPVDKELPAFRELTIDGEDARATLRALPEMAALADGFRLHSASSLLSALSLPGRSSRSLAAPWQAASAAFSWSPVRGEQVVILSGDSQGGALLVAYVLGAQGPRFSGSYLTKDEHAPILVAYRPDKPEELLYSTCWGCGGEGGALRLDAGARLRFMPR